MKCLAKEKMFVLLLHFILYVLIPQQVVGIQCLDENGDPVDRWVVLSTNDNYRYYYFDGSNGFVKSPYTTNQTTQGNIMSTMNQFYSNDLDLNNIAYALYNDDPPPPDTTASSTYAHAKGVMITDNETGFWLAHSKPNWPNARAQGAAGFPDSDYSQSLMCMTLNSSSFDDIAAAQMVNYPYLYDSYISANLETMLPSFAAWIGGSQSSELNVTNSFSGIGGDTYIQFAKNKKWGRDLYDDFVAPTFNESLNVETWRLGAGGRMGSICRNQDDDVWETNPKSLDIMEVESVVMPDGASWLGTQDHSKWAITTDGSLTPMVCIGDVNRMCSQENRGGGAVCVYDEGDAFLWNAFNASIGSVEDCWAYDPCTATSTQCYWCPDADVSSAPSPFTTMAPTAPEDYLDLTGGDITVIGVNTDNPDEFSLLFLVDVSVGVQVKVTDKAWNGTSFVGGEGILGFTITQAVPAGTVINYYGTGMADAWGEWERIEGSFALSTSGDQLMVFVGKPSNPTFLFALTTTDWVTDPSAVSSSTSVLPQMTNLENQSAAIYLEDARDGVYIGAREGTPAALLNSIVNTTQWNVSATDSRFILPNQSFVVLSSNGNDNNNEEDHFIFLMVAISFSVVVLVMVCVYYRANGSSDAKDKIPLRTNDSEFSVAGI